MDNIENTPSELSVIPRFHIGSGRYESLTNSRFRDFTSGANALDNLQIELPQNGHGTYGSLLFDKRWKEKRLEIIARDNGCCVICFSASQLQVHHRQYHFLLALKQFKAPWDYEDYLMITLCDMCHSRGHAKFRVPTIYI